MLRETERWVNFYELFITTKPQQAGGSKFDLLKLLQSIVSRVGAQESFKLLEKETAALRLQKLEISPDQKWATLLFSYSDTTASEPVFENLETMELRFEPKLEGEGICVSAHVVVSLERTNASGYLAAIEKVPGLGRSKVELLLRSEFKAAQTYEVPNPAGDGSITVWADPEFEGLTSETLKESLESGILKGIEVVRRDVKTEWDHTPKNVKPVKQVLYLKTEGSPSGPAAMAILRDVGRLAKEAEYDHYRVRFRGDGPKDESVLVHTDEDVEKVSHVHQLYLEDISPPLKQATDEIHATLTKNMRDAIVEIDKEMKARLAKKGGPK